MPKESQQKPETTASGAQHLRVIVWLRDRIVQEVYPPGSRLPEPAICEQLGISRTPLRDALKVLAAERLVTLHPNRGAVVTEVSLAEVDHAMTVMASLEALGAQLFCAAASAEDMAQVQELTRALRGYYEARDLIGYFKVNQALHAAILNGAGNPALSELMIGLTNRFARQRLASNRSDERWLRAVLEHEHLALVLADRNGVLAAQMMSAHVLGGWAVARAKWR